MNRDSASRIALNAAEPPECRVALCAILPEGKPPDWVELIPAGEKLEGSDGRVWLNDKPEAVVAAFNRPIPIDYEHATELKAPKGEPAPAAGWIEGLELRSGAVWGRVVWTPRGVESLNNREYRFLSPAFLYEKKSHRVFRLVNAGLTNNPNLSLTALNRAGGQEKDINMDLEKIAQALGLPKTATEAEILTAINSKKADEETALNKAGGNKDKGQPPSLDKFVPRAEYELARNRADAAEKALAGRDEADLQAKAETAVNAAIAAGKITPASKPFYLATCAGKKGLEQFENFVKTAPKVIPDDSGLDGKEPADGADGTALNAEEASVAAAFGNSAEDIAHYGRGKPQPKDKK